MMMTPAEEFYMLANKMLESDDVREDHKLEIKIQLTISEMIDDLRNMLGSFKRNSLDMKKLEKLLLRINFAKETLKEIKGEITND